MTKQTSTPAAPTSAGADDLTRIRGIGPVIARRLITAGVTTFDEIAARSSADLAALIGVAGLSAEQIARKDWVGQAHALAAERLPAVPANELFDHELSAPEHEPATMNRQHYATFMVELLLDEENDVRRTRVAHVQGGAEDSWAGWRATQLLAFFTQSAQIQAPQAEAAPPAQEDAPDVADDRGAAQVQICGLELASVGASGAQSFLLGDQPFEAQLALAFSDVSTTAGEPLVYSATVYAKNLRDRSRHTVSHVRDALPRAESTTVRLAGSRLPRGIYHLEAVVSVKQPADETGAAADLTAFWEGGLVQVY
jgi:hypothetical protein